MVDWCHPMRIHPSGARLLGALPPISQRCPRSQFAIPCRQPPGPRESQQALVRLAARGVIAGGTQVGGSGHVVRGVTGSAVGLEQPLKRVQQPRGSIHQDRLWVIQSRAPSPSLTRADLVVTLHCHNGPPPPLTVALASSCPHSCVFIAVEGLNIHHGTLSRV
jgi:hypothetical protein